MTKSTEILNAVQKMLVEFANQNNINLADDFKSVDEFKQFVIAFTFKTLTDLGIETSKAFDIVAGEGAYDKLARDLWEAAQ